MRVWVSSWLLQMVLIPYLRAAPTPGAPDPDAFRHWQLTLQSESAISGLAHGQGKWIGVGSGVRYSTNGVDWLPTGWPSEYYYKAVYAEGVFVAVGNSTWSIIASTNGVDWRGMYPQAGGSFLGVAYGNGVFVAAGPGFAVATNPPPLWWVPNHTAFLLVPQAQPRTWYGLFFGGGKFVAGGGQIIGISTNGRDWTETPHPEIPRPLWGGTFHNGRYIAVGEGGTIIVSDDAINWTQRPSPTTANLRSVMAHENQYVAVGYEAMLISTNGLDWEKIMTLDPDTIFLDGIASDHSFAAVYFHIGLGPSGVLRSDPFNCIAPLFTKGPVASEQRIGLATNLFALAEGTSPLIYQWQKNGADIAGATSNELAFGKLERGDDAKYRVIARNAVGETTSAEARLTVGLPVRITALPVSQGVPAGGSITFSVEYEGTPPITNRWRKPGSIFITQVVNEERSFLRLENVQPANAGTYGVLLENKYSLTGSGPVTLSILNDSDGDGLPDDLETKYGLTEPAEDFDGDGMINLQEYQAGTDPRDAQSYLKMQRIELEPGADKVILSFIARSNHTYTIQGLQSLSGSLWTRVLDVVAAPTDRVVTATNAMTAKENYFRLVTPRAE